MTTKQLIDSAVEHLRTSASVKTVYGEPVVIDGKTIIPVANVASSVGGGAKPLGVVEISGEETKFVSFGQTKKLSMAAAIASGLGLVLGLLLGRRSKNGHHVG